MQMENSRTAAERTHGTTLLFSIFWFYNVSLVVLIWGGPYSGGQSKARRKWEGEIP